MFEYKLKPIIKRSRIIPFIQLLLASYRRRQDSSIFQRLVTETDIFLVGHPKSGNTWMAYMLAIILHKDTQGLISLANVGKYVPVIHGNERKIGRYPNLAQPRIFRNEWPVYPELYPKTIYLIRDPRSVLVSLFHMYRVVVDDDQMTMQAFIDEYLTYGCIRRWEPELVRWDKQVLAWTRRAEHDDSVLMVKYEDMVNDLEGVLERTVKFAGIPYDQGDIALAVPQGSFDAMQVNEEQHGVESYLRVKSPRSRFIRLGKVDSWKEELDRDLARQIENELEPAMNAVGYM